MKNIYLFLYTIFFVSLSAQDGALDNTFGSGTGANSVQTSKWVSSIAVQPDKKILVGGWFDHFNNIKRNGIARLNADGSVDNSFDPGSGADPNLTDYLETMFLQADGKIMIGGFFKLYNGTSRNYLVRLNTNGTLDLSFDAGTGLKAGVVAMVPQTDGKIIIARTYTPATATGDYILRLNPDGSIDNSFNTGSGMDGIIRTVMLQPDGKIIIVGLFTTYNNVSRKGIARLNADGSLDQSFNPGSGVSVSYIETAALQADGKILIGGYFKSFNGINANNLARLNTDGSVDATFKSYLPDNSYAVNKIEVRPNNKILIAGGFDFYNNVSRTNIARLNSNGTLDMSFDPGMGAENGFVRSMAMQQDGKLLIGGDFTSYNGIVKNSVARILLSDNLSVNEISKSHIWFYPNPVKNILHIRDNEAAVKNVEVYDINGRQILAAKESNDINLTQLPKGNYIMKVESENETKTFKIIKD